MITLGVDPAYSKPTYVARFIDGAFDDFERVPYTYAEQPVMFFDAFKRIFRGALDQGDSALLSIEKPVFIKVNAQAFMKVHEVYVALTVIAQFEGINTVRFAPSSWRKMHGFRQGRGVNRQEIKSQAIVKCEEIVGRRFLGNQAEQSDKCESFLIGLAALTPKRAIVTINKGAIK